MKQSPKYYLLIFSLLCACMPVCAQILPGDANNNGRVDHYDILNVGYAFGTTGPTRIEVGVESTVLTIQQFWGHSFPNGLNFAFADANGNGWVELTDFLAISQNYGLETAYLIELMPSVVANNDLKPQLSFADVPEGHLLTTDDFLTLDLDLSGLIQNLPSDSINGLAFTLLYDNGPIADFQVNIANNWLNSDSAGFAFKRSSAPGKVDIALTRLGSDPFLNEGGSCGTVSLTIVDDLIWLLEGPADTVQTCLSIENVIAVDGSFNQIAIDGDTLCVRLYLNDVVAVLPEPELQPGWIKMAPNPSDGEVRILTEYAFEKIELVDVLARSYPLYQGSPLNRWELNLPPALPSGQYWLKLYGPQGMLTTPIFVQK